MIKTQKKTQKEILAEKIQQLFPFNTDYIQRNLLSDRKLTEAGVTPLAADEYFVKYPGYTEYYISSYGRLLSLKNQPKLIQPNLVNQYYTYQLSKKTKGKSKKRIKTAQRMVAEVFCPNFWGDLDSLHTHHLNGKKLDNYYRNLILLPPILHSPMNRVKRIAYFKNGKLKLMNPLEIHRLTGLSIEEIVMAAKGKTIKSYGKYSVFEVKGELIGFEFYPKKNKKKIECSYVILT